MRRAAIVAFAALASLLVVTAQPAAATTATVSENTTDTDFSNASTLSNFQVVGSGKSATVETSGVTVIDDFEDADLDPVASGWSQWSGKDSTISTTTSPALNGSTSGQLTADPLKFGVAATDTSGGSQAERVAVSVRYPTQSGTDDHQKIELHGPAGRFAHITLRDNGTIEVYDGSSWSSVGSWQASTTYRLIADIDYGSNKYHVSVVGPNTTVVSNATAAFENGVGKLNEIKHVIETNARGQQITGNWDDVVIGEPINQPHYLGDAHDVDDPQQAFADLETVNNASLTLDWQSYNGSSWSTATKQTVTTAGNKTVSLGTAQKWRLNLTVTALSGNTSVVLASEGVTADVQPPSGSNPDPTGRIGGPPGGISLNVSDPDFGTSFGDTVNVTATNRTGGQLGTTSISANQTVSFSPSVLTGENNITWTLNDSFGQTTTISQDFETPATLTIRNETRQNGLVDNGTVEILWVGESGKIEKDITLDGTITMTRLPADAPFIARLSITGYHPRTVFIDNIYEQRTLFLLRKSADANEVRFRLLDRTGVFDGNTIIQVERVLENQSNPGSRQLYTIAGERTGAGGFTTHLAADKRHRIKITNPETGETRVLGPYSAPTSETVELTVSDIEYRIDDSDELSFRANYTASDTINFVYSDPSNQTEDLQLKIYERGNKSNTLLNSNYSGPHGNLTVTQSVPAADNETVWRVEWSATRDGDDIGNSKVVGPRTDVLPQLSDFWANAVSILLILMTGAVFSQANDAIGIMALGVSAGMLWFVGLASGVTSAAAIVIVIGIGAWLRYSRPATIR